MIATTPIQANHEILPRVLMLPVKNPSRAATTTNTAVQAPCSDKALKAVLIPEKPAAAQQVHPVYR